jgi:hypothetical protein
MRPVDIWLICQSHPSLSSFLNSDRTSRWCVSLRRECTFDGLYCSHQDDMSSFDLAREREEKRQRHHDVAFVPTDAEGAPGQARGHSGDGDSVGVLLPSELAQDNEPLLPLDLVYRHILPHAFDTPTQAASFCLVCSYFREATSRLWFWTDGAWMLQLVVMRIRLTPFDDENERGALMHMLPTIFKARDVIQAVGLKETIGALVGHSPLPADVDRLAKCCFKYSRPEMAIDLLVCILAVLMRMAIGLAKRPCTTPVETLSLGRFSMTSFMVQIVRFAGIAGWFLEGRLNRVHAVVQDVWSWSTGLPLSAISRQRPMTDLLNSAGFFCWRQSRWITNKWWCAKWHLTREEQELSPFLIARIGDGRWARISDRRGVLEWCDRSRFSDEPVLTANGDMAYVFLH